MVAQGMIRGIAAWQEKEEGEEALEVQHSLAFDTLLAADSLLLQHAKNLGCGEMSCGESKPMRSIGRLALIRSGVGWPHQGKSKYATASFRRGHANLLASSLELYYRHHFI